jgi:hypothetical protein
MIAILSVKLPRGIPRGGFKPAVIGCIIATEGCPQFTRTESPTSE